ncbi:MAG: lactonase family protein [Bryobacteraceae bacterium]
MSKTLCAWLAVLIPAMPMLTKAAPGKGGAVFVMTNAADKNEIVAFERNSDGSLYAAGRYATEGRGSGGVTDPLQSQGSLILSQDQSHLFAVNAGSGTVSVFRVRHATLTFIDKAPSGGAEPVAVAQWHDLVYVLNAGGPGSIVAFRLDGNNLKQIRNSTVFLTANTTGASSISISPDGQFLLVTERTPNNIDIFPIKPDGTLGSIVVNHSSAPGVFSASFSSLRTIVVSETGPPGASNGSTISSYSVLANGTLSAISSAVPTLGAANCWDAMTPNGKWIYASNAGSSNVSGFAIGNNGSLTPVGGTIAGVNPAGSGNLDIAISTDSKYLYTLNSGTGKIGIFAVGQDGLLSSLADSGDFPQSSGFNGIAAY